MRNRLLATFKKRQSFLRFLEHEIVSNMEVKGKFIDLGAKSDNERYYEHLDMRQVSSADFCDITSESQNVKKVNLENPFPIENAQYDSVIYFNVLEHIYNYSNLISETHRILKKGGVVHVIVPFMWQYHGDPDDYNRFTFTALYRKYNDAGFKNIKVYPIGPGRWTVISMYLSKIFKNPYFKFIIVKLLGKIQKFENLFGTHSHHYALAFYLKAEK